MKLWSAFYPFISHLVQGCPEPMIDHALRNAAIEFCNTTHAWQTTESLAVQANVAEYDLPLPGSNMEVAQVLKVSDSDDYELTPTRHLDLDRIAGWETDTGDKATMYVQSTPGTILLYPIPTAGSTLTIRSAYRPALGATGVEDFIFETWRHAIVHGALAELWAIPDKPWTAPDRAVMDRRYFNSCLGSVRADKNRGLQFGTLRVKPVVC